MNSTNFKNILFKIESFIFLLIVCANLYPIFGSKFFGLMDAPAHLYNADLIRQLAFNHNTFLETYIKFNPLFVPNWLCHIIMAPLLLFFSANVSEKILLTVFFAGLPLAARYCVGAINKNQKYIALLILPFTYNFLSMVAFYNFSLGLIFMFLTIGFFYRNFTILEVKNRAYFVLFLLLFITYLCHIVVLGVTILYVFLIYLWYLISTYNFELKKWFSSKTIKLLLVLVPILILMSIYFKAIHSNSKIFSFLNKQELFNLFKDAKLLTIFSGDNEQNHSNFIALFFLATFFVCIYLFFANLSKSFYKKLNFYFLLAFLMLMVLYLKLPDSDGLAGFVTIRICLLIFILTLLLIATSNLSANFLLPICFIIVLIHFKRLDFYKKIIGENSVAAESVVEQSKFIEANSFVVSYKYDESWLTAHYANYLCVGKPSICFANHECITGYFPLVWKDRYKMTYLEQSLSSFQNIESVKKEINQSAVYYWVLGDLNNRTDSVSIKFKQDLINNCLLINSTKFATLYKLK